MLKRAPKYSAAQHLKVDTTNKGKLVDMNPERFLYCLYHLGNLLHLDSKDINILMQLQKLCFNNASRGMKFSPTFLQWKLSSNSLLDLDSSVSSASVGKGSVGHQSKLLNPCREPATLFDRLYSSICANFVSKILSVDVNGQNLLHHVHTLVLDGIMIRPSYFVVEFIELVAQGKISLRLLSIRACKIVTKSLAKMVQEYITKQPVHENTPPAGAVVPVLGIYLFRRIKHRQAPPCSANQAKDKGDKTDLDANIGKKLSRTGSCN